MTSSKKTSKKKAARTSAPKPKKSIPPSAREAVDLNDKIEAQIADGRKATLLGAVRSLAASHTIEQILDALSKDDAEYIRSLRPIDLVLREQAAPAATPKREKPAKAATAESAGAASDNPFLAGGTAPAAAAAPATKGGKKTAKKAGKKAAKKAAKVSKKASKKLAPPHVEKAPDAGKKSSKASEIVTKVGEHIGRLAAGTNFKTGALLAALGDPKARVKVTAALNSFVTAGKLKRHGNGRASSYEVVG